MRRDYIWATYVSSNSSKHWWVYKSLVYIDHFPHIIGEWMQNYFLLAWNVFLFGMEDVPLSLDFVHDSPCPLLWSSVFSSVEMAERQLLWLTSGTSWLPVHLPWVGEAGGTAHARLSSYRWTPCPHSKEYWLPPALRDSLHFLESSRKKWHTLWSWLTTVNRKETERP